jgi:hypothetical protein
MISVYLYTNGRAWYDTFATASALLEAEAAPLRALNSVAHAPIAHNHAMVRRAGGHSLRQFGCLW